LLIAAITLLALALRLGGFGQGLFADELSTAWVVLGHGLGHVVSSVRSNDEITPPLFFVLAWASSKLGSNPDLLRLPSLVAGVGTVPIVYAIGMRTVGRRAALIAAAIIALSPFLVYYSTEARSYALMIALVGGSSLALLNALDDDRPRWWVVYAALSVGAMYSHYTAVFPLLGQFAWAFWTHPTLRRRLLLANAGAALAFAPWIPGYLADQRSPTTAILAALQPFDPGAVARSLATWSVGFPYVTLRGVPGLVALALLAAGLGGVVLALAVRFRSPPRRVRALVAEAPPRVVLVVILALATPVGEALYSLFGANVLGPRNLNASWPGLALLFGLLLAAVRPPRVATVLTAAVLAGFAVGTVRALGPDFSRPDYPGIATFIDDNARSGDVVVDSAAFTPVPLTGLDLYLAPGQRELQLGLPRSQRPFTIADVPPPPEPIIRRAFAESRDTRLFLVRRLPSPYTANVGNLQPMTSGLAEMLLSALPRGFRVEQRMQFAGLAPIEVDVIAGPGAPPA
jgi:hypothetical protein